MSSQKEPAAVQISARFCIMTIVTRSVFSVQFDKLECIVRIKR